MIFLKKRTVFNFGALVFSNICSRLLGLIYKLWLVKMISPTALGLYQLSLSVYSVFLTPVASGLPSATTRLCAKYMYENKAENVLVCAIKLALIPLLISGAIMLFAPNLLAGAFLHDKSAGNIILALIPAVTLGGLASLPAGYLHAQSRSFFPAVFEIAEQIFKILCAFLLIKLFGRGLQTDAVFPALAISLGGILSCVMMFLAVGRLDIKKTGYKKELFQNAFPPTLARLATSLLHLGTTTVLPLSLMAYGLTRDAALAQYGILTSMAYPVVFMPITVTSALCMVYMPKVAKNLNNKNALKSNFRKTFFAAFFISVLFAAALILFAPFASKQFFNQALAGRFMVMLVPCVLFSGINQVCSSTLSGLGKQKTLMITSIIDGSVGLLLTLLLVRSFGIYGFILGNCIQDLLAFAVNFYICLRCLK